MVAGIPPGALKHPALSDAYERMGAASAVPLWEIHHMLVADAPTPHGLPHLWRWAEMRPLMMEAGTAISAEEAERRVLALKNPGLDRPGAAQTVFAGLQMVMPGETAPAHRHSQAAIRFVLESDGGHTAVEGERCTMARGDFITTPSWTWHDHANTGAGPLIWLDGLDVPLVNFFGARFAEDGPEDRQPIYRPDDASVLGWGSGFRPFGATHARPHSPVLSYPYARARAALAQFAEGPADPHHGWKLTYSHPLDGGHVLPTLSAFLQLVAGGRETRPWRSTEATVFAVVEGEGRATIGEAVFDIAPNDILVAPNWTPFAFAARDELVLFSFSDRAAQERLGIWRGEAFDGS